MKTTSLALPVVRAICAAGCVSLILVNFFGSWSWHVWVAHFSVFWMEFILLAPHAFLPIVIPSRPALISVVLLYALVWAAVWYWYQSEVASDPMNADPRGVTGGIFLFSNGAFVVGLAVRAVTSLLWQTFQKRGKGTLHAV
jgi:hypothetical protein